MYKTKLKWHPQIIKITYSIFCPIPKGEGVKRKISFRLVYKTEYTHNHLFICIYRNYLSVCPPIVPFSNTSLPYSSVTTPLCVSLLLCLYILSPLCLYVIMSSVLCYHVFTYSVPYVFMSFWLHKCKVFLSSYYFVGKL